MQRIMSGVAGPVLKFRESEKDEDDEPFNFEGIGIKF